MGSQFRAAPTAGDDAPAVDRRVQCDETVANGRSTDRGIEALYRHHQSRLLRFFAWRTPKGDAQDLVQDTFARYAALAEDRADTIAEPAAYLTQVAANLLRDRAKFAVRRATAFHQVFDDESDAGHDPIAGLEARDLLRRLDAAVQKLQPRRRRVFLLQRVEGMTYTQIAEISGMSVRTVKKQMAKALLDLRREFGPL